MTLLSAHQPNYLPYPGLIGKIMMSDKFIYVSNVQFDKKSWQNRNRIKTGNGPIWLTVPTITKSKFNQKICDVEINNKVNWRKKHFQSIRLNYKKSQYYSTYIDFFENIYSKEWEYLYDLDVFIMNFILDELDVKTEILYDKDFEFSGNKTDFLIDMCKKTNCNIYLSNKGSENYVDIETFENNNLDHVYMNYIGTEYNQCFYGYDPYLSIIDMLFNCGKHDTKKILEKNNNYQISKLNKML